VNIPFKQCNASNYRAGRTDNIKYIVIHYTGNSGDTAKNNADYFAREANLQASAHYFVDANEIWQSVKDTDTAWSVGDGGGKYGITNANSISIELCDFVKWNDFVVKNSLVLVRLLMEKYSVPIERVVRHYDASRKLCPLPMVDDTVSWDMYKNFIIKEVEEMKFKTYGEIDDKFGKEKDEFECTVADRIWRAVENGDIRTNHDALDLTESEIRTFIWCDRKMQRLGIV